MNLTAPPDKFYWSVIDTPVPVRSSRRRPSATCTTLAPGLFADLAADVPLPIEELHAVALSLEPENAHPSAPSRTLVCAALRESLASLSPDALTFGPSSIPAELGIAELKPAGLAPATPINLLVGEFEPRPIRRARVQRHLVSAACVAVCALLVSVGLHRRAAHALAEAAALARSTQRLVDSFGPGATADSLSVGTSRLREAATLAKQAALPQDVVGALGLVLSNWNPPDESQVKPLSLSVRGDTVNASLLIEGDPAAFLSTFTAPAGWSTAEPRLTRSGQAGGSRVELSLKRDRPLVTEHRP